MAHRLNSPEVDAFQKTQLAHLKTLGYAELLAMARSERISAPSDIQGIEFWIERRVGEAGGVRIEARACRRSFFIFMSCRCPGFEMLPDGTVVPDIDETPDD